MKASVIRFNRYFLFIPLGFLIIFVLILLSGCGGGSSSGTTTINTYVAGSFCFDNAIDSSGNIWVANGGTPAGTIGTAPGKSHED